MVCVIAGVVGEKLIGTSMRKAGNGGEVQGMLDDERFGTAYVTGKPTG